MEHEADHSTMSDTAGASCTVTETVASQPDTETRSITLRLRKRKTDKKVEWSSDTVDNENLGRRSSKCCCVYNKARVFGESSSESEDDDDEDDDGCGNAHCIRGHKKPSGGGAELSPEPRPQH
ncbi:E3 ubiquitin-protein ligase PPP1R11 isoform X2 [Callorhinchus milii]|nr:E3 ubiquitin-protein ligase PPP1R11 isoform X2 [Callorhinchus milii]